MYNLIVMQAPTAAANEAVFDSQPRGRTVPILKTIMPVDGYPRHLVIFKIAASKFWQVRCRVAGITRRKSTRSQSIHVARHFAREFYQQLLADRFIEKSELLIRSRDAINVAPARVTEQSPVPDASLARDSSSRPKFIGYADHLVRNEQARVARGEYTRRSLLVLCSRLDSVILPALGQYPVADISHVVLQNFANSLSERFTSVTVSQYLIAVRKVLSVAVSSGATPSLPEFPKVKAQTNSRGPFTPTEYWQLLRKGRALCGQPAPDDVNSLRTRYGLRSSDHTVPPDLAWVIGFMVNSFIRPSDLKTLKHKHVEIVNNAHTYLRLTLPATKSHDKPIVTLQPAVRIYRLLTAHHHRQDLANPNDYLFLPQHKDRAYAARVLAYYFNCVMAETGLKHGAHGQPRSLYSLRHSSITFRLLYGHGIDVLTLARNARTSVDMINRHYASTLTAEQNIGILQSRRPQGRQS
jgi:hypothetical protein